LHHIQPHLPLNGHRVFSNLGKIHYPTRSTIATHKPSVISSRVAQGPYNGARGLS
jgi:hypothetical protein